MNEFFFRMHVNMIIQSYKLCKLWSCTSEDGPSDLENYNSMEQEHLCAVKEEEQ